MPRDPRLYLDDIIEAMKIFGIFIIKQPYYGDNI